jgi:hypothetical protein
MFNSARACVSQFITACVTLFVAFCVSLCGRALRWCACLCAGTQRISTQTKKKTALDCLHWLAVQPRHMHRCVTPPRQDVVAAADPLPPLPSAAAAARLRPTRRRCHRARLFCVPMMDARAFVRACVCLCTCASVRARVLCLYVRVRLCACVCVGQQYASGDRLATVARIFVGLSIVFSYPLCFVGLRDGEPASTASFATHTSEVLAESSLASVDTTRTCRLILSEC